MLTSAHLTVLALPALSQQVTQALGEPLWVDLATPFIATGLGWTGFVLKDWWTARRRNKQAGATELGERETLIASLLKDVEDARAGEADARAQRDAITVQRDAAHREIAALRREIARLRAHRPGKP